MASISHAQRAHAVLSASGASRWMTCPPSAKFELNFEDTKSEVSKEGELAHELSELILKLKLGRIARKLYAQELEAIKLNALYDKSMWDHCNDFVIYVLECYSEAQSISSDAVILLEHRFDLREFIPEGFGTGDVVIACSAWVMIIDLKYGKGVAVDANKNKQLMIYGIGGARLFDLAFDIETVRMVIFQPRLDSITEYVLDYDELLAWGLETLKPAAELAYSSEGDFIPGNHCQFCKAKVRCKALAEYNLKIARLEFADPNLLTDEEITDVLGQAEMLKSWLSSITNYALIEALKNTIKWPGYKLVSGRSKRVYAKPLEVVKKLCALGFEKNQLYKAPEILGITEMQKLIGPKDFNAHLTPFIIKAPGAPALVPISDKRPELNSSDTARIDFAGMIKDED